MVIYHFNNTFVNEVRSCYCIFISYTWNVIISQFLINRAGFMESAILLKAIIENSNEGIITIDDTGIVESIITGALRLFDYTAEEVIGNNISMLMPEPYKSQHDDYINKYLSTGKKKIIGIGREVLGQKKNGSTFPFWLSISEVNYENRKIFTGFVQDLSKQKEAEEMLRLYTEELEEVIRERTADLHTMVKRLEDAKDNVTKSLQKEKDLNRLKSQFVSMASHAFRTPLGSVQLSASLINKYAEKNDIEGVHKHTLKIRNSVDLLTNILNDFLSLDRLEGEVIEPHPKSFNIVKFSEEIIEEMQSMTKQNQNIVYQHTGNIGTVYLDPH